MRSRASGAASVGSCQAGRGRVERAGSVVHPVREVDDGGGDRRLVGLALRQSVDDHDVAEQPGQAPVGVPARHRRVVPAELDVPGVANPAGHHRLVAARARLARQRHHVVEALGVRRDDVDGGLPGGVEVLGEGPRALLLLRSDPGAEPCALVTGDDDLAAPLVDPDAGADHDLEVAVDLGDRHGEPGDRAEAVQAPLVQPVLRQQVELLGQELVESEDHAVGVVHPLVGTQRPRRQGDAGSGGHGGLLWILGHSEGWQEANAVEVGDDPVGAGRTGRGSRGSRRPGWCCRSRSAGTTGRGPARCRSRAGPGRRRTARSSGAARRRRGPGGLERRSAPPWQPGRRLGRAARGRRTGGPPGGRE